MPLARAYGGVVAPPQSYARGYGGVIAEETYAASSAPWLVGWGNRIPIYRSKKPGETLTDMPHLVRYRDSAITGGGVTVTTSDGQTEVPIGTYAGTHDLANGVVCLRAKLTITDADTIIGYLYWDASQTTTENRAGVVSNSYKLFAPLQEDPSDPAPQVRDWVTDTLLGTSGGSMTSGSLVDAIVGNGLDFDGTDDFIDFGTGVGTFSGLSDGAMTVRFHTYLRTDSTSDVFLQKGSLASGGGWSISVGSGSSNSVRFTSDESSSDRVATFNSTVTNNVWLDYAITTDATILGTGVKLYQDGVSQVATSTTDGGTARSETSAGLSNLILGSGSAPIDGILSHLELSSGERSANWLAYVNKNDFTATKFGLPEYEVDSDPPYLAGYTTRKPIYVEAVPASDLRIPQYPKLFNETDADVAGSTSIAFTLPDGTSTVPVGCYNGQDLSIGKLFSRAKYTIEGSIGDLLGYLYYKDSGSTTENKPGLLAGYSLFMPLDDDPYELEDSLIDWWEMDGSSSAQETGIFGTVSTGGTLPTAVAGWRDFESASLETLTFPDSDALSTGDIAFSVHVEVQLESLTNGGIVAKAQSLGAREYHLRCVNTGAFRFEIFNSAGTSVGFVDSGAITTGVIYTIDAWHDPVANTVNIQVDGGTINSAATTGVPSNTVSQLRFGTTQTGGADYDGLMRRVGFWKRILTTAEKTALQAGTSPLAVNHYSQRDWVTDAKAGQTFGGMVVADVVAGQFGEGLELDGTDDLVKIDRSLVVLDPAIGPEAHVLSCWFKTSTISSHTLVDFARSTFGINGLTLTVTGGQLANAVALGSDFSNDTATSTTDVVDNAWHKLELVWLSGDSTVAIYVDGVQEDTEATTANLLDFALQASRRLAIGAAEAGGDTFGTFATGPIQHVTYNRNRVRSTPDQVAYAYQDEKLNDTHSFGAEQSSGSPPTGGILLPALLHHHGAVR
jgi:hypothetical protein